MQSTINQNVKENAGNEDYREGGIARAIERKTAKLPSDIFLWAALGAMGASLTLNCSGKKEDAQFVGQWVAPLLLLGVYNKIVKVAGHDAKGGESGRG